MQTKKRARNRGFTITETLIVLAVSGALLLLAIGLVSGRQNRTQFMTAINNLQQQVQQIINETSSGFASGTDFHCQGSTAGGAPTISAYDPANPSSGCVFLGKVLQFGTDNDGTTGHLVVYPIVGNQQFNSAGTVRQTQSLTEAHPVAAVSTDGWPPSVNSTTTFALENGLKVPNSSDTTSYAVAFISSLGDYTGCTNLCSGSQQFSLYKINGVGAKVSPGTVVNAVNSGSPANFQTVAGGIQVCVNSGTTDQSGLLTIGGDGNLSVALQVRSTPCA